MPGMYVNDAATAARMSAMRWKSLVFLPASMAVNNVINAASRIR